jgi:hypothetical protein
MYRIELVPGEVTVFRTIEELATGVRNGLISSKARIYHNASGKWLPIEFHPHYKAALALLAGRPTDAVAAAPRPAESPSFENLSFLKPAHEKPADRTPARHLPNPFFEPDIPDETQVDQAAASMTAVEPPRVEPAALPSVSPSPVLELPRISYPQFAPADPPVAESASGARPRRRLLNGAVALLVLAGGGYAASVVLSPAHGDAATTAPATMGSPASRTAGSADIAPETDNASRPTPAAEHAPPSSASSADTQLPPASSGFAPALDPRAIVSAPLKPAKSGAVDSLPAAAPSIEMDVSVPALADADSLAGTQPREGDSAIKKILRAVNGGRELPGQR